MTVTVFKRRELKYLLDRDQLAAVMDALDEYMSPDRFHRTSVRNVYFDTENFLLARRSIDKPLYKEKLRFRSYGRPSEGDDIFVELKKKYDSVVYKRRLTMPLSDAMDWFLTEDGKGPDTQIGREIGFLKERYPGIRPAMLLCYEREAYCAKDGGDLRITIDSDVTAGTDDTDLCRGNGTFRVLPDGYTLMEVKSMYGYPWWLVSVLGENGIYKTSFSKYGNAYKRMILDSTPEEYLCLRDCEQRSPEHVPDTLFVRRPAQVFARGCGA